MADVVPAAAAADGVAAAVADERGGGEQGQQQSRSIMTRFLMQGFMIWIAMQVLGGRKQKQAVSLSVNASESDDPTAPAAVHSQAGGKMRNLYRRSEECELFLHLSPLNRELCGPTLDCANYRIDVAALRQDAVARQQGFEPLWHKRIWYEGDVLADSVNVTIPPLPAEVLTGGPGPHILATLLRVSDDGLDIPEEHIVRQSLPLMAMFRDLNVGTDNSNLFGDEEHPGIIPKKNLSSPKLPYFKSKIEIRPVFDETVHSASSIKQGPFRKLRGFPEQGFYQPFLYVSDFWSLEKDYIPLNMTLEGTRLNITLSYSAVSALVWSLQAQMSEQWSVQGDWGLTDTQRDSFMFKRLCIDTNPYLLGFSGVFLLLHTFISLLAFKNDIQFWRKNESMQGLSARSMVVSFICQAITTLYLLDSQETSRLILFNIVLDTALATWKLRKAVKVELDSSFPFLHFGGQKGYENAGTSRYDDEAIRYMGAILGPLFLGYSLRSAIYGKHRGWYSFLVGSAAGGVYTFGFAMMTPQLYINYKLKSVEHLPWRALTYKAMNTFVDDIAALLIDMPMMHRLSCFRDDIIFFIYLYQRWAYRVDKTRPSMWVQQDDTIADASTAAVADGDAPAGDTAVEGAATGDTKVSDSGEGCAEPTCSDDADANTVAKESEATPAADKSEPRRRK
jgi:hypothetical protein